MRDELYQRYLNCLCRWIPFSRKHFYRIPDRPELACYGTGYDEWGVQTTQKAFSAYAVLATDENTDERTTGLSREQLLADALSMLRYTLRTHKSGDLVCNDNFRWGHTWLSSVGTERMMHGVDCVWEQLTQEDHAMLRRVLLSESDWLTDHYPVTAGKVENNHPESNLWNGSILTRAALYYPDAPRADEYREKAAHFFGSAMSLDYDKASEEMYDGRRLSELCHGDNFFRSFALDHHQYMNVGYIIISLSQIAMLHYAHQSRGLKAPDLLYRHVEDVWQLVRLCTFPDGRLLRLGGDNRVRYCYCQDYCVPTWIFMGDRYQDEDCAGWERQWLDKLDIEQAANGDGSFLSERCGGLDEVSPLYYTRLEADRACACSLGVYWRRLIGQTPKCGKLPQAATQGEWMDAYHGAMMVKTEKRTASFVWLGGEPPTALCMPTHRSDLAEWRENLCGSLHGFGGENYQELVTHQERRFAGGFVTSGVTAVCSDEFAAEDQHKEILTYKNVACAALPDDETMVILQYATANMRCYLTSLKGLYLNVPNDIFNAGSRTYYTACEKLQIPGAGSAEEILHTHSTWLNIDDCVGLSLSYGDDELTLYRPGKRQIGIRKCLSNHCYGSGDIGMLYCDEICAPFQIGRFTADRGATLIDNGFVVKAGVTANETKAFADQKKALPIAFPCQPALRGLTVRGADDAGYALVANFGDSFVRAQCVLPGLDGPITLALQGKTSVLLAEKNGWKAL